MWITTNCGKFWKCSEYQNTLPASWDICIQVKKQHLEQDMEQQTGSKLGKEYIKTVYCHPAYLTFMQSTSCKMLEGRRTRGWQGKRWLDGITDSMDWVRVNSGSWWWTGRTGVLQSMGSQRVRHDWATELYWNNLLNSPFCFGIHLNYIYFTFPLSRFKTREDQIKFWHWSLSSIHIKILKSGRLRNEIKYKKQESSIACDK